MKKPNIKQAPWSVSKYKPTSVLSGERDVVAENLSEKDAQTISAVPEMLNALMIAKEVMEKECIGYQEEYDEVVEALQKAGVEL